MFEHYRVIHFVGIGGIGMSGIAEILKNLGYDVTGSDLRESDTTRRLVSLGIKIHYGHRAENINNAHVLVVSSAVSEDNPEVVEAKKRNIPVIPRAEMLAELGRLKYSVLIAGAHGKTTTTSLIGTVLAYGGMDPTLIVGGKLRSLGTNAKLGQGDFLIAEADESDGSFLKLNPTIAVITNIDREHMEFFKDMDSLKKAFIDFSNKVPFYGTTVLCVDNPYIRDILPFIKRRFTTYGFSEGADFRGEFINYEIRNSRPGLRFRVYNKDIDCGEYFLPLFGRHNILNALAGFAVATELRIPFDTIRGAYEEFGGIERRLQLKGIVNGIRIYDDYGHHPTEIRATLGALKELKGILVGERGRIILIFQPHRYTRTRDLFDEFTICFRDADLVFLMDIYPAGERPIEGIDSGLIYRGLDKERSFYIREENILIQRVMEELREGDILVTMGAGNVWKIGEEILRRYEGKDVR